MNSGSFLVEVKRLAGGLHSGHGLVLKLFNFSINGECIKVLELEIVDY